MTNRQKADLHKTLNDSQELFAVDFVRYDPVFRGVSIGVHYVGPAAPKVLLIGKLKDRFYLDKGQQFSRLAEKAIAKYRKVKRFRIIPL